MPRSWMRAQGSTPEEAAKVVGRSMAGVHRFAIA
jgi:hypothetical protein